MQPVFYAVKLHIITIIEYNKFTKTSFYFLNDYSLQEKKVQLGAIVQKLTFLYC